MLVRRALGLEPAAARRGPLAADALRRARAGAGPAGIAPGGGRAVVARGTGWERGGAGAALGARGRGADVGVVAGEAVAHRPDVRRARAGTGRAHVADGGRVAVVARGPVRRRRDHAAARDSGVDRARIAVFACGRVADRVAGGRRTGADAGRAVVARGRGVAVVARGAVGLVLRDAAQRGVAARERAGGLAAAGGRDAGLARAARAHLDAVAGVAVAAGGVVEALHGLARPGDAHARAARRAVRHRLVRAAAAAAGVGGAGVAVLAERRVARRLGDHHLVGGRRRPGGVVGGDDHVVVGEGVEHEVGAVDAVASGRDRAEVARLRVLAGRDADRGREARRRAARGLGPAQRVHAVVAGGRLRDEAQPHHEEKRGGSPRPLTPPKDSRHHAGAIGAVEGPQRDGGYARVSAAGARAVRCFPRQE